MAHPWEKLLVWQKAHNLVLEIYKVSGIFPESEKWGLTSQLRKAIVSVPANIVEGKSKKTDREFLRYLYISRGSLEESRYYILLAADLGYLEKEVTAKLEESFSEISYLLNKLISSIAG